MSLSPGHHGELLRRSTEQMVGALRELRAVSDEMVVYLAAQRWHDAVRRRVIELRDHSSFT
jgi:hypothetical protein